MLNEGSGTVIHDSVSPLTGRVLSAQWSIDAPSFASVPEGSPGLAGLLTLAGILVMGLTMRHRARLSKHIMPLVTACLCFNANAVSLTDGLVAHYPFNGDSGDASGNGNHGVMTDTVAAPDRFLLPDGSLAIRSQTSHIDLPIDFENTQTVTISAWVAFDPGLDGSAHNIFSRDDNRQGIILNYNLQSDTAIEGGHFGTFGFYVGGWSGAEYPFKPEANRWYSIIGTYDQEAVRLYLDGTLVASQSFTGGISYALDGANWIGNGTLDAQSPLNGRIDDVRIYSRALTDQEVAALYSIENQLAAVPVGSPGIAGLLTLVGILGLGAMNPSATLTRFPSPAFSISRMAREFQV